MKTNPRTARLMAFLTLAVAFFAVAISREGGTRTAFFALGMVFLAVGVIRNRRGGSR